MNKRKFYNLQTQPQTQPQTLSQSQTLNNNTIIQNNKNEDIKPFTYTQINNNFKYHSNDKFHDKPLNIIQFIEIYK